MIYSPVFEMLKEYSKLNNKRFHMPGHKGEGILFDGIGSDLVKLDVTGDMSYATVYVSAIEGKEKTLESVKALKGAAGYVRRELGSRLKLRKVPELRFIADDSIEISANISRIVGSFNDGETGDGE